MSDKWIKASEIGEYLYCQRAWWYRLQGETTANVAELALGSQVHAQHGRGLRRTVNLRVVAYVLLALAVALLILQVVS